MNMTVTDKISNNDNFIVVTKFNHVLTCFGYGGTVDEAVSDTGSHIDIPGFEITDTTIWKNTHKITTSRKGCEWAFERVSGSAMKIA
jgi:hypothetical protein